jgi:hypothetical protein
MSLTRTVLLRSVSWHHLPRSSLRRFTMLADLALAVVLMVPWSLVALVVVRWVRRGRR